MELSFFGLFVLLVVGGMAIAGTVLLVSRLRSPRPRPYPSCGRCGYDVSGSLGSVVRCPECGASFAEAGIVPIQARSRWSGAWTAGVLTFLVLAGFLGISFMLQYRATAQAQAARAAAVRAQAAAALQAALQAQADAEAAADGQAQAESAAGSTPGDP